MHKTVVRITDKALQDIENVHDYTSLMNFLNRLRQTNIFGAFMMP